MARELSTLERRAQIALEPLQRLASQYGCEAGLAGQIWVQARLEREPGKGAWYVQWCCEMDGRTFVMASLEWAPPKVVAELTAQLARALTSEGFSALVAETITKIPKASGATWQHPPNFWE